MTVRRACLIAALGLSVAVLPLVAKEQTQALAPASPAAPASDSLVLKAERTLDFTTDEVTWLSLDGARAVA